MAEQNQGMLLVALLTAAGISVINVGLTRFADTLEQEDIEVLHVDWQPPAGGDGEFADMLAALTGKGE